MKHDRKLKWSATGCPSGACLLSLKGGMTGRLRELKWSATEELKGRTI